MSDFLQSNFFLIYIWGSKLIVLMAVLSYDGGDNMNELYEWRYRFTL
jgi:hypothetical protein